jgi:hypothetical protein
MPFRMKPSEMKGKEGSETKFQNLGWLIQVIVPIKVFVINRIDIPGEISWYELIFISIHYFFGILSSLLVNVLPLDRPLQVLNRLQVILHAGNFFF